LAKRCSVSVRTLERFFLPAFGHTPRRWLKQLRMQRAIELLCDGTPVKETAGLLGYQYATYFSRDFRKAVGVAPRNYAGNGARKQRANARCRDCI
jgi:AraC-like DNA-binding protein